MTTTPSSARFPPSPHRREPLLNPPLTLHPDLHPNFRLALGAAPPAPYPAPCPAPLPTPASLSTPASSAVITRLSVPRRRVVAL
jgi:hypothetical protein